MVFCSAMSAGEDLLSAAVDALLCMGSCAAVASCVTVASLFAAASANTGAAVTTPCNRDATMAAARYCLGKYDLKNMIGTPLMLCKKSE